MKRQTVVAYAVAGAVVALAGCGTEPDSDAAAADSLTPQESAAVDRAEYEDADAQDDSAAVDDEAPDATGVLTQVTSETFDREIIYTIGVDIATEDVQEASRQAASLAHDAGGYVADESTSAERSTVRLRVPADQHADVVGELQQLGTVLDRSRSTEDVTQDVVDTQSRISSQRESISRIRALLDEAGDLSDVIDIEAELASREADLDALLSRQARLADLTAMATINATFTLSDPDTSDEDEGEQAASGFVAGLSNGWNAFGDGAAVALTGLGAALPFLAFGALVGTPLAVWARRRRPAPPFQAPLSPPAA
ncbi:DUF4349 domain-containing protein [Phytoactinopolyspora mesophila]|uniref:DUF4349 domain-containing protein n=1 Tax=Phytoactinopolyspora mesophila TaxID=2650750 RepID=A0A7K3LY76_9ACTN|nr:DUF4349 domain-containing protein [Phytoactinopolyspora mesophila]NDL55975.1 DUF4349 domain-containing protein [Phytoactinopolyspora mesophila]